MKPNFDLYFYYPPHNFDFLFIKHNKTYSYNMCFLYKEFLVSIKCSTNKSKSQVFSKKNNNFITTTMYLNNNYSQLGSENPTV